jgi:hypothetical protein
VTKEEVLNRSNYGYHYSTTNTSLMYAANDDLRPSVTNQVEVSYRRGFLNGGTFRVSGIYRWWGDIHLRQGTPTPVITNPTAMTYGGYFQRLTYDPTGKRTHVGLEMEWAYPLYRSALQNLHFQGSWTVNRTKGTSPWREGNNSHYTASQWYDLWDALGIPTDEYNPYGELRFSTHNVVNAWLVWSLGERNGINNTFSLLGRYNQGAPFELYHTKNLNTASPAYQNYWERTHLGTLNTTNITTSYRSYFNGRGRFSDDDNFRVDLRWNFTIPIKGRVQIFSEFTINNVFNTLIPWGSDAAADGATARFFGVDGGALAWNYDNNQGVVYSNFDRTGLWSSRGGTRSMSLSTGLRF